MSAFRVSRVHVTQSEAEGARPERVSPWVLENLVRLTFYLLAASVVSAAVMALWDFQDALESPGSALGLLAVALMYLFVIGGLGCLPGLAVWLVILSRLPLEWSVSKRRLVAVATAPLVGIVWLVAWILSGSLLAAFVFGLFWPLGAGFVVRLRAWEAATDPRES